MTTDIYNDFYDISYASMGYEGVILDPNISGAYRIHTSNHDWEDVMELAYLTNHVDPNDPRLLVVGQEVYVGRLSYERDSSFRIIEITDKIRKVKKVTE